jgi:hypothetical protein
MSDKPQGGLTPATVFERLLTFMDKPWKAVVVVVLVIVCGLGYMIYLERGSIADAVLHKVNDRAELNSTAFLRDADKLLRDTRGDYALLIELHLIDNIIIDRVGVDRDGNRWIPSAGAQQALMPESSMPIVVQLLSNDAVCLDVSKTYNDDMKALQAKGYQRVCMVMVPPILGVSVGGLVLAWIQPLLPAAEAKAKLTMTAAAMRFATW